MKPGRYFQNKLTSDLLYMIHPTKTLNTKVVVLDASCDITLYDASSVASKLNINGSGTVENIIDPALTASSNSYTKYSDNATVSFCCCFSLFDDETKLHFVKMKLTTNIDLSHNN